MENNKSVIIENNRTVIDAKRAEIAKKRAAMEKKKALIEKRKKEIKKRKMITAVIAVALVIVSVVAGVCIGRSTASDDNSPTQRIGKNLSILSITESGDWVTVKTSYITFKYPFAFSDIIEVEAFNDELTSQLRFYSEIDGKRILNYSINFNSEEGIPCGTIKGKIPVSVMFKEAPKKLSDEWRSTYDAVQETFNDVLKSMEENGMVAVAG